jgi:hypothetical protein
MATFSTMARRVIESFAAGMSVPAQAAADHSYGFEFARSGKLSIILSREGARVIISLARSSDRADITTQMRLLSLSGFDSISGAMIHAGISSTGAFILALDIEEDHFDVQVLNDSLVNLAKLLNSII